MKVLIFCTICLIIALFVSSTAVMRFDRFTDKNYNITQVNYKNISDGDKNIFYRYIVDPAKDLALSVY